MAYSDPGDLASGAVITEAWVDAVRGNDIVSPSAIVTTKGDLTIATAANTLARFPIGADDSTIVADSNVAAGAAWQIQPAARVYNDADIDPATSSWVSLTFNQERYDTDTVHNTVANTERLTCPDNGSGLYHIGGNVRFDNHATGVGANVLGVRILLNGADNIAQNLGYMNVTIVDMSMFISCDYALSDNGGGANDYVELQVYTVLNIDILSESANSPEFWCHWFRRA